MSSILHELVDGYNYYDKVKGPSAMDMCSDGSLSCLKNDFAGLIAYVDLLTYGNSEASTPAEPLGRKFFMSTGVKCKDTSGVMQDRYIYFNTIPTGEIELMPGSSLDLKSFKGLVPGIVEDIGKINPLNMFSAFMENEQAPCMSVTLPVGDAGTLKPDSKYMIFPDIEAMSEDLFTDPSKSSYTEMINNYYKNNSGKETFQNKENNIASNSFNSNKRKVHNKCNDTSLTKMPDDILIKIYFSALGLFGLFILMKLFHRKG